MAAFAASFLVVTIALAFPSSRLVYTRGPGAAHCPNETALRKEVAKRLGYDPFFPSAARTIVASVVLDDARLKGQAQLVDEQGIVRGTRQYFSRPDRCEELLFALALSISISIDPTSASSRQPPPIVASPVEPASRSQLPPPVTQVVIGEGGTGSSTRDAANSSERPPPPDSRSTMDPGLRWAAILDTRLWLGALPGLAVGGAASFSGRSGRWSGFVELGAALPTSADLPGGNGRVPIRASQAWVGLAPCAHWDPFFACGVFIASRLAVHRSDIDSIGDTTTVTAAGGRLGVESAASALVAFRLQGDLLATMVRTPVTVVGQESWRAPPWSTALSMALVLHLP